MCIKECARFYSTTYASNRLIEYKIAITDGHATLNYAKDPKGTKDPTPFTDTYIFEEFSDCKNWKSTWNPIDSRDY